MDVIDEPQILAQGLDLLRKTLGAAWQVEPVQRAVQQGAPVPAPSPKGEQVIGIQPPAKSGGGGVQVLVEARRDLSPLQARTEFQAKVALMHNLIGTSAVLVLAPWLSPRTRDTLDELGYNYLDLTGNVSLRLQQPAVVIRTEGARQNPSRSGRREYQKLRGATAGRLVRVLVDSAPPYRVTDLAKASGVTISYVSRLLDALEDEALITRDGKLVVDVDWQQLLRARASQYELLKVNPYVEALAQRGPRDVLDRLRSNDLELRELGNVAVTGSYAAREVIQDAAIGGQLMIYVQPDPRQSGAFNRVSQALGLLRTDLHADVLLIAPANHGVFERASVLSELPCVGLSQLAIDLLGGTGRMPQEGNALLRYMAGHISRWRAESLPQLRRKTA